MTIRSIRRFAQRNVGRRVEVDLKSGREFEGVIVFAGRLSLILRRRVRGVFVRTRIFYRNIAHIERDRD